MLLICLEPFPTLPEFDQEGLRSVSSSRQPFPLAFLSRWPPFLVLTPLYLSHLLSFLLVWTIHLSSESHVSLSLLSSSPLFHSFQTPAYEVPPLFALIILSTFPSSRDDTVFLLFSVQQAPWVPVLFANLDQWWGSLRGNINFHGPSHLPHSTPKGPGRSKPPCAAIFSSVINLSILV